MDPPSSLSQQSFQCPVCSEIFRSARSLGGHKASHTRQARQSTASGSGSSASPDQLNVQSGPQDATLHTASSSSQPVLPSVEASTPHDSATAPSVISADNTIDTSSTLFVESVQQLDSTPLVAAASSPAEIPAVDPICVTDPIIQANLPPFVPVNLIPTQAYNNTSGEAFVDSINVIYEEIIRWRKNLFLLPSGQYGKKLIALLSEWISLCNNDTCFQGIFFTVFIT